MGSQNWVWSFDPEVVALENTGHDYQEGCAGLCLQGMPDLRELEEPVEWEQTPPKRTEPG